MLFFYKIFVTTCLLSFFCFIVDSAINLHDNSVINQNAPNKQVVADTLIINKLFKQGYRFIDGPSDSLLFYFEKALILIQNNLTYLTENNQNKELKRTYNKLKARALIEFGIECFIKIISAKFNLSEIHEKLGKHQLAFQYFKEYSQLKDSLFNAEKYRAIKEMEVKYESEKKEQQLALLTQANEVQQLKLSRRNRMMFGLIAGIILLILIGYLLRSQSILKSRQKEIELEQRLFRSQMNPHFIFNSLIAIQSYIYKKEPIVAGDYLAQFANLMRLMLENTREEFISLAKETKTLHAYLKLQQLRFENKFDYLLQVDDGWDAETIMLPPMFAQPFVENAIEHGIRHKTGNGNITVIYAFQDKKSMTITIKDDGVGRKKAREIEKKKEHQSLALNITKDRLRALGKKYKYEFTLELTDLKNNKNDEPGTKVSILIPYKMS